MISKLFTPILPATTTKPISQSLNPDIKGFTRTLTLFRDFLSTGAWLELGAALFIPIYLALHPIIGSYVLLLPVAAIAYRVLTAILMTRGVIANPYMQGVIPGKVAVQIPDPITGEMGPEAASQPICVLLVGVKNNHPLGPLAPGFKEMGEYFGKMQRDVEEKSEEFGLLAQSSWIELAGRQTANEMMNVQYYRSSVGLNKFAHSESHMAGLAFWNKHVKEFPHLAIYHEVFEAPAGAWEGIYVNAKPTLLGKLAAPIKTDEGTKWQSGLVDARRGPMATMKGRMPAYASQYV